MLRIHIKGFTKGLVYDIDGYFKLKKEKEWFNCQEVKDIIKDIDGTIAVKDEYMESPVFGGMSPDGLSGGCKAVILLAMVPNINVFATRCGDNCVPSILKLAKKRDINITLHHLMKFNSGDFEAYIVDTDTKVYNMLEFITEYEKALGLPYYKDGVFYNEEEVKL